MLYAILAILLATGLASAVHGWDNGGDEPWFASKGVVIMWHAPVVLWAAYCMGLPWYGAILAGSAATAFYWAFLRSSWQARVELTSMDRGDGYQDIWQEYILPVSSCYITLALVAWWVGAYEVTAIATIMNITVFVPGLSVRLFNYKTKLGQKLGWNHGRFWDCRRATELITGVIPGGACIAALIYGSVLIWNR